MGNQRAFAVKPHRVLGVRPRGNLSVAALSTRKHEQEAVWDGVRPQAKYVVSQPDDPSEREADRIAERVMRMPAAVLQRSCGQCSGLHAPCPSCTKSDDPEAMLRRAPLKRQVGGALVVSDSLLHGLGTGKALERSARAFFEPRFGHDFAKIRIHADAAAAESAHSMGARAYTLGNDIVFGAGEYAPTTDSGRRLIAHELTHTVQQAEQTKGELMRAPAVPIFCGEFEDWVRYVLGIEPGPISDFATCFCLGGGVADVFSANPAIEGVDCLCNVLTTIQLAFGLASDGGCLDQAKVSELDLVRAGMYAGATVVDCATTFALLAGALVGGLTGGAGGTISGGPPGGVGGGVGGAAAGAAGAALVDAIAMALQNLALQGPVPPAGTVLPVSQWQACQRTWERFGARLSGESEP